MPTLIDAAVCLLPVLVFLGALRYFDSFKLVRLRTLWVALGWGLLTALAATLINDWILFRGWSDNGTMVKFYAPVIEEVLKCAAVWGLLRTRKAGFVVDAAIYGFAVGAAFAFLENGYYLFRLDDPGLATWLVRGFGTSLMHGGTTALFAVFTKLIEDTRPWPLGVQPLPGLAIAVGIHMGYNQFLLPPISMALVVMLTLPPLLYAAFVYSERQTRRWLGEGIDRDMDILSTILEGDLEHSRLGRYLDELRRSFPGPVMADVMGYLRIRLELSVQAKALLMMRENGIEPPRDAGVDALFTEMEYLEGSIGRTGIRALQPLLGEGGRELWQLRLLK